MGRLFWKIFLAFQMAFLSAGAVVGAVMWLHHNANEDNRERPNGNRGPGHIFVEAAAATLRSGGEAALRGLLQEWAAAAHPHVYAFDDQGRELLGRAAPPEFGPGFEARVETAAGRGLRLVSVPPPGMGPHPPGGRPPRHRWPPPEILIGTGLAASLLFSAWLAWYLAKPVRNLRQAFAAVAEGKLDTRVAVSMGSRRDEIADLGRDFDHMAERIGGLVDAHRRLMHDVSHELRSPLARLQAAVGLIRQRPDESDRYLGRVEKEVERVNELVGELLALSRLESGLSSAAGVDVFDLAELVADIVEDARFEAGGRGINIELDAPESLLVCGQIELLHRAVENVARNAVRHSPDGGLVTVGLWVAAENNFWSLAVDDAGPGVAEAELPFIFEPFYRCTGGQGKAGAGLGLTIARLSMEFHGGSIRASNRERGGLRVELAAPVRFSPGETA